MLPPPYSIQFIRSVQFQPLQQIAKSGSDILALRKLEVELFLLLRCLGRSGLFKSLHAQADPSVCNFRDLNFDLLSDFQNFCRSLNTLLADLRHMKKTGHALSEADKCAIILDCLNSTLCYESNLDLGRCILTLLGFLSSGIVTVLVPPLVTWT